MRRALSFLIMILAFLPIVPALTVAQSNKQEDVWSPLRFFIGSWIGTGKGQPGISQLQREYQFILNGKFIQARHTRTGDSSVLIVGGRSTFKAVPC